MDFKESYNIATYLTTLIIVDKQNVCPKATVSLPYFIQENQILNEGYVYPEVSEKIMQTALFKSLQANQYNVDICDSSKTINHFCRFSGGGDLYITGDNSSTLVFVSPLSSS